MINIAYVNAFIKARVIDKMADAENGRISFERGAKARFLTSTEVIETAFFAAEEVVPFDLLDFTEYLQANPEILDSKASEGDFQSQLQKVVHGHITKKALEWLSSSITFKCTPDNLSDVMTDITTTVDELIVNVPRTNTYSLTRSVDAFIANDTYDAFKRVQHTVIAMRAEMKRLILALDIANPPGACIAAQAWRRLVEIEDQLVWMEARIPKSMVA